MMTSRIGMRLFVFILMVWYGVCEIEFSHMGKNSGNPNLVSEKVVFSIFLACLTGLDFLHHSYRRFIGLYCGKKIHLRDEFNFWNVHRIMNTLGLLQSK